MQQSQPQPQRTLHPTNTRPGLWPTKFK
jgi:hypothetical protein